MRSLCFLSLCFFAVFGSKRTRTQFETDSRTDDIAQILNTLVGSSGSKIDMVRDLVRDDELRHFFLSMGYLEVEAFEILSSNPSVTVDEAVSLFNERIPISRTISKREFQKHRVHFWGYILVHNHSTRSANIILSNIQILTSDDGIDYIQLTDSGWDRNALKWLLETQPRTLLPPHMIKVQVPRALSEFQTILPPVAREFVHRLLRNEDSFKDTKHLIHQLRFFDTRSVLFRKMREYMLTIRSLGFLDHQVETFICESDDATNATDLAIRINSQFNETTAPVLRLLYTAERLQFWLKPATKEKLRNRHERSSPSIHRTISIGYKEFQRDILAPLTMRDVPGNITPETVRIEWEKYERHEAGTGKPLDGVKTEILSMAFDPDFDLLPSAMVDMPNEPVISKEVKRAVLQYMLDEPGFDFDMIFLIANAAQVAEKTGYDESQILRYMAFFRDLFCAQSDIAYELARINRRRIVATPESIVRNGESRQVYTKTERVRVFYNLMREWFRGLTADERVFGTVSIVCIEQAVWKEHFIKPLFASVGESV